MKSLETELKIRNEIEKKKKFLKSRVCCYCWPFFLAFLGKGGNYPHNPPSCWKFHRIYFLRVIVFNKQLPCDTKNPKLISVRIFDLQTWEKDTFSFQNHTHACIFSTISTNTSMISTRTSLIYTRIVWFSHAEWDFDTQSVIFTFSSVISIRTSVIFTCINVTLTRTSMILHVWVWLWRSKVWFKHA
jgi:hypothetical protein